MRNSRLHGKQPWSARGRQKDREREIAEFHFRRKWRRSSSSSNTAGFPFVWIGPPYISLPPSLPLPPTSSLPFAAIRPQPGLQSTITTCLLTAYKYKYTQYVHTHKHTQTHARMHSQHNAQLSLPDCARCWKLMHGLLTEAQRSKQCAVENICTPSTCSSSSWQNEQSTHEHDMQPREGETEREWEHDASHDEVWAAATLLRCRCQRQRRRRDAMPSIDAGSATVQFSVRAACVCVQIC